MSPKALGDLLYVRGIRGIWCGFRSDADFMFAIGKTKRGRVVRVDIPGLTLMQYGKRRLKRLVNKDIDRALA